MNIARQRLYHQHIASATFQTPGQVVEWLGAVQAQDYLGALWAVGLRMAQATETDIEQALIDRTIVRTWPMRGTIHFVPAADVRWMLELMTPRVMAATAGRLRQAGLDEVVFARSEKLLVKALQGGRRLTRTELYQLLEAAHISTAHQRGLFILNRLAQSGVICFAARVGRQPAFALLAEWVPQAKSLPRDEALAKLSLRYFSSHGPATAPDFAWWTGLTIADAKAGLDLVRTQLIQAEIAGQTYWSASSETGANVKSPTAYLLPGFDEYLVGYRDRSAVLEAAHLEMTGSLQNWLNPAVVVDGQVVGTWKRTLKKDKIIIAISPFTSLTKTQSRVVAAAADRYGAFLGLPVELP